MEKVDSKIHIKTAIKANPETIYRLITTSEGWDAWFTKGMVFNLERNSEAMFSWKDWGADKITESERAVILDFVPNKYLKFNWNFFFRKGQQPLNLPLYQEQMTPLLKLLSGAFTITIVA